MKFLINRKTKLIAALTLFMLLALVGSIEACPNCKGAVAENGSGGMASGFAWSIGWLLLIPISILTAWCVALRRLFRSAAFCRN